MKNRYYIKKANKLTDRIRLSVCEYNKMIQVLSSEIDRLEENIDYYRKGYIDLYDSIEEAIEYIEKHCITNPHLSALLVGSEIVELLDILKGSDKDVSSKEL